jgi:hypothetical protein
MKCFDNGLLGWRIFHDLFNVQAERNFKYGSMGGGGEVIVYVHGGG